MSLSIKNFALTPTNLGGLTVWLDAFRVNGTSLSANNTSVSTWTNLVSGGSNFTQATSSRQPTFLLNSINNNFPGVYFNSSNTAASIQFLFAGPSVQTTQDASFFYVVQYIDVGVTTEQTQIDQRKDAGTALRTFKAGQNQIRDPANNLYSPTFTATPSSGSIRSYRDTLNTALGYYNGTLVTSVNSTYNQQVADNNGILIGCHFNAMSNDGTAAVTFAKFYLGELLIYNKFFSLTEQQQIEGYLAWKWGLQTQLPTTHPYRFFPLANSTTIPPPIRLSNQVVVSQTTTFLATGAVQTFTVPAGVFAIRFFLWGAGGKTQNGNSNAYFNTGGASGAYVEGNLATRPGITFSIIVGGSAQTTLAWGGGSQSRFGGGGGGFSGIFSGTPSASTVLAIAGGGGGGGTNGGGSGGGGGYPAGGNGTGTGAGTGGTQVAGGTGLVAGAQLAGGSSAGSDGGGGGGGWYGGGCGQGGGAAPGGGGGSSTTVSTVLNPVFMNGVQGISSPTDAPTPTANESSPYWISPSGRSGQNGLVVIGYTLSIPPSIRFSNIVRVVQSLTFLGTGAVQTWTVPPGVFAIRFFLWGAGGFAQNGNASAYGGQGGGSGGYMEGNILTTPGTTYYIIVGRTGGVTGLANGAPGTGGGGANAGGFSGIFSGSPAASNVIAIAGGGGGSGFNGGGSGGGGGYPAGGSPAVGGGGGTQTQGGAGYLTAGSGSQLQGGNGVAGDFGGGGGGGGWYGGGGGTANPGNTGRPGGGGSSTFTSIVFTPVWVNGNFGPTTSGEVTLAANESSPYWISPYGRSGQFGLVVIGYNQRPITIVPFAYTGSYITYTVPNNVSSYYVYMWGAGGSGNSAGVNGGAGAFLSGILSVTPGETLRLIVGKGGVASGINATDAQGYGGSSLGGSNSAQGGGRSAIQRNISGTYTEIVTVGGGGGAGYYSRNGGAGSYTSQGHRGYDQALTTAYLNSNPSAGGGGGSNTGGQGAYGKTASDGVQFRGGDVILSYGNPNGGGGGGGWYGGGGGSGGTPGEGSPGGGGSSYSANLSSVVGEDSSGLEAPGTSSPFYPGGTVAAAGISSSQAGGNGYIALIPL